MNEENEIIIGNETAADKFNEAIDNHFLNEKEMKEIVAKGAFVGTGAAMAAFGLVKYVIVPGIKIISLKIKASKAEKAEKEEEVVIDGIYTEA